MKEAYVKAGGQITLILVSGSHGDYYCGDACPYRGNPNPSFKGLADGLGLKGFIGGKLPEDKSGVCGLFCEAIRWRCDDTKDVSFIRCRACLRNKVTMKDCK